MVCVDEGMIEGYCAAGGAGGAGAAGGAGGAGATGEVCMYILIDG